MLKVGTLGELKQEFSVNDDIEIELSHDAGSWRSLPRVEGVLALEQVAPGVVVAHLEPRADVDAVSDGVLRALLASGNRVRSFHPRVPSLDQLYLRYVGGGSAS